VNRKTTTGRQIGETQKISIQEALQLYTINAAYHSFDEDTLGTIEEGKLADFVVLGEDIMNIDSSKIKDIPIKMTIVGGKIVYER
jgi:predicted amidohydrolase YtcJ